MRGCAFDCFAAVARGYVRWPLLWLVFVTAVCLGLGWVVGSYGDLHIDTDVNSFVVRGTLLSNRRRSASMVTHVLSRYPPEIIPTPKPEPSTPEPAGETPSPKVEPTPEPTPEPTEIEPCSTRNRWMHMLFGDDANVVSYDGLMRACRAVEAVTSSEVWRASCAGPVADHRAEGGECEVVRCEEPVWLLSLPDMLMQQGSAAGSVTQLIDLLRGSLDIISGGGLAYLHGTCAATGTVDCALRPIFNCAGVEEPEAPQRVVWLEPGSHVPPPPEYWAAATPDASPTRTPDADDVDINATASLTATETPPPSREQRLARDKAAYAAAWARYNAAHDAYCAAPCFLDSGRGRGGAELVDLCGLLLTTNASVEEVKAIAFMPKKAPMSCNALTPRYVQEVVAAVQALVSWGKRSSQADRLLPYGGGRVFFTETSVEDAAAGRVALGELESTMTRVIFRIAAPTDEALATHVAGVARVAEAATSAQSLTLTYREWDFFEHEAQGQLLIDGRWAVGSIVFVLVYIIIHAGDVCLGVGAIVGILLSLPVSLFAYRYVLGLRWVGILHATGLFFITGVGADDFFVLLAHWREANATVKARNIAADAPSGPAGDDDDPTTRTAANRRAAEADRVAWTMRHSLTTVTATSLTTAGAFLGNCASDIAPIKLFGLFMAVLIMSLLLLLALWFPPLFVLTTRRRRGVGAYVGVKRWLYERCCVEQYEGDAGGIDVAGADEPVGYELAARRRSSGELSFLMPVDSPERASPRSPVRAVPAVLNNSSLHSRGFQSVSGDVCDGAVREGSGSHTPGSSPPRLPVPHAESESPEGHAGDGIVSPTLIAASHGEALDGDGAFAPLRNGRVLLGAAAQPIDPPTALSGTSGSPSPTETDAMMPRPRLHSDARSTDAAAGGESDSDTTRGTAPATATPHWFVDRCIVDVVLRYHRPITAVAVVVICVALFIALQLPGPDGKIILFPAWHNQARYFAGEEHMDTDVGRIDLRLTWGVLPVDHGNLLDPDSSSGLELDSSFDCTTAAAQVYLLRVCEELEERKGVLRDMVDPGSVKCPMLSLQRWLREAHNKSLPLPEAEFLAAASNWYWLKGRPDYANFYYHPDWRAGVKPFAMTAWVGTRAKWQVPWRDIKPNFQLWEDWLAGTHPPPEAANGFHSAGDGWTIMETQQELQRTAVVSLVASLCIAFAILTLATKNIALAGISIVCIIGAVVCLVAFMTLAGWNLGVVESVCITVVVGMSCDYVVHIAALYAHMSEDDPEATRVASTLRLIGHAVLGAAVTSIGAAVFLLGCTMTFLSQFGMFVIATLTLAFATAVYVLPSTILTAAGLGLRLDAYGWEWRSLFTPCARRCGGGRGDGLSAVRIEDASTSGHSDNDGAPQEAEYAS